MSSSLRELRSVGSCGLHVWVFHWADSTWIPRPFIIVQILPCLTLLRKLIMENGHLWLKRYPGNRHPNVETCTNSKRRAYGPQVTKQPRISSRRCEGDGSWLLWIKIWHPLHIFQIKCVSLVSLFFHHQTHVFLPSNYLHPRAHEKLFLHFVYPARNSDSSF